MFERLYPTGNFPCVQQRLRGLHPSGGDQVSRVSKQNDHQHCCCPRFVMMHMPGKVTYKEIDEMIATVDKNDDGKISYSEFRVMLGALPLVLSNSDIHRVIESESLQGRKYKFSDAFLNFGNV